MADSACSSCSSAGSCSSESCEGCPSSKQPQSFQEKLNEYSSVKKVIGVVSGKGGVGKSFVTASLATAMRKKGYEVGILDADITGPSIPKMFGVHGPAMGSEMGILPIAAEDGTKIMSINLLMEDEEAPVIWRGPDATMNVPAAAMTENHPALPAVQSWTYCSGKKSTTASW